VDYTAEIYIYTVRASILRLKILISTARESIQHLKMSI
jgi:hypothetical protein